MAGAGRLAAALALADQVLLAVLLVLPGLRVRRGEMVLMARSSLSRAALQDFRRRAAARMSARVVPVWNSAREKMLR